MEQDDLVNLMGDEPSDDENEDDEMEEDNPDEEETANNDEQEALLQGTDFMSPAFRGRG